MIKNYRLKNLRLKKNIQNFGFLFNRHRKSKKPNVLIFSTPRSGSTWLMELIWSQPGFKPVNEPLNLRDKWLCKKSGITGFKELYSEEVREKVISYFKEYNDGKQYFLNPSPLNKNTKFFTSRIVFKVINGGEFFINDIAKQSNSKIVYLLRHPIAVALSRKQLPRTKELTSHFVLSHFTEEEQVYAKKMMKEGNAMEKRILAWCIQNKFALKQKNEDWLVISYESLTCNPQQSLESLANHCELPDANLMLESVNIPSAVSVQSEDDSVNLMQQEASVRNNLISKWKSKVTEREMLNYFEICRKMNFNIYTNDSDFPNLKNLH